MALSGKGEQAPWGARLVDRPGEESLALDRIRRFDIWLVLLPPGVRGVPAGPVLLWRRSALLADQAANQQVVNVTLADGRSLGVPPGTTYRRLAEDLDSKLARRAIAARINGQVVDLDRVVEAGRVDFVLPKADDPDALHVIRHSAAHVMAEAICALWPQTQLVYGPPVDNGFYYDIDLDRPLSSEDFEAIEKKMAEIVEADKPFKRYEMPRAEAMAKLRQEGNPYKIDNAERAEGESLTFYTTGSEAGKGFEDLCRGPHVPSTGRIGAFKVLNVSGAYYRGDASQKMLQRVYGTAWPTRDDLKQYLHQLAEAAKRDHRVLGPQLGLFTIDESVGQGLVLWKPNGAVVRQELQDFISEHLRRQGYSQVFTPHIGRLVLYKTSGHYPYYRESQFPPLIDQGCIEGLAREGCGCAELANRMSSGEIDGYLLKPMNCPHHIRIYASEHRSYRDLPIRLAEFGTVYRWEKSGELGGMTRVRGFTQDDAHLFCTEEQLPAELRGCLELVNIVLNTLGMKDYRVRVGLRDEQSDKYVGAPDRWARAQEACRQAAETLGVAYTCEEGEAAFYGPKIDFIVKDCIGREWQLGTVQVDYNLPERFGLEYIGPDNAPHRPVMIHRAPFGSMERFVGLLIEHFAGAFPLWLAPEQVRVATVSEKSNDYALQTYNRLRDVGIRARIDTSAEKIGAKIRTAALAKVPYILVIGEQEAAAGTVNVRHRSEGQKGTVPIQQFIEQCLALIRQRCIA
jgi:threonyl-tRNA synthetase